MAASMVENHEETVFAPSTHLLGKLKKYSEEAPACADSRSRMADHLKRRSMTLGAPRNGYDR